MFILENLIGSLFFGTVIGLVLTALVFLACMMINRKTIQTPVSMIVIGAYFIFAAIMGSLIVGCMYAKNHVDSMGKYITVVVDEEFGTVSQQNIAELRSKVMETYQSHGNAFEGINVKDIVNNIRIGATASDYIVSEVNGKIDDYTEKWVIWLLFGTLLSAILASAVSRKGSSKNYNSDLSGYGFDNDTSMSGYY